MNHLTETRIFLGPLFHKVAVPRHQLAAEVRIYELQAQRQPSVSLDQLALVVAFQRFQLILLLDTLAEYFVQIDRVTELHVDHLAGQYAAGYSLILLRVFLADARGSPVAALARHFHYLLAGSVGTLALVALGRAGMPAYVPRIGARLGALLPGLLARPWMAYRDAPVPPAGERFVAGQPAGDLLYVTGHRLP